MAIRFEGAALGDLLRLVGLRREEVAATLEVSVDTVDNWCSDRTSVRLRHFVAILSLLAEKGVSPAVLRENVVSCLRRVGLSAHASTVLFEQKRIPQQKVVPLIVSEINDGATFFAMGARAFLHDMGIELLLMSTAPGSNEQLCSMLDFLMSMDVKGVLAFGFEQYERMRLVLNPLIRKGYTIFALYERYGLEGLPTRLVSVDNFGIGYSAGCQLLREGHERVGTFGLNPDWPRSVERVRGFEQALVDASLHLEPDNCHWASLEVDGRPYATLVRSPSVTKVARQIVQDLSSGLITGVFCTQRTTTSALLDVLLESGCSRNDIQQMVLGTSLVRREFFQGGIRIPYILIPAHEIGREAARLLTLSDISVGDVCLQHELVVPDSWPTELEAWRGILY